MVSGAALAVNLKKDHMKLIKYSPEGLAVADQLAEEYAKDILELDSMHISTCNVVNEIRALVAEGTLTDQVVFEFEGEKINCSPTGTLSHWPRGFGDQTLSVIGRILRRQNGNKTSLQQAK